jgi:hypothetical protein
MCKREIKETKELGSYVEINVEAKASEALKIWEQMVEEEYGKVKMPIFVFWSGETDVEPKELGRRIGRLLAKMNVSPLTLKHEVNIEEEEEEEW